MRIQIRTGKRNLTTETTRKAYARLNRIDYPAYIKVNYMHRARNYDGELYSVINDGEVHNIEEARIFMEATTDKELIQMLTSL